MSHVQIVGKIKFARIGKDSIIIDFEGSNGENCISFGLTIDEFATLMVKGEARSVALVPERGASPQ